MKTGRIILIVLLVIGVLLCCCASVLVPVVSKYAERVVVPFEEKLENGEVIYHPTLDFTINGVFIVDSQEEFFSAISHGYPYIQLSPEIENPLIINQHAGNLDSDMILDLNGIEIQRNGYEPILNIGPGVRLTVTDTSEAQTGGLYNPVGSVFNINGGILTVMSGVFESGPRYSEYYTYNHNVLANFGETNRTLVEDAAQDVVFSKNNYAGGFTAEIVQKMPIITSYPVATGSSVYLHGNLYFDKEITTAEASGTAMNIEADTYCYYRTSEDFTNVNVAEMADWYYTYWVNPTDYSYHAARLQANEDEDDYVQVTIYGYENVIENAAAKTTVSDYYAAIQMQSGKLSVQNGAFYTYFGVDTTACVNASGGELDVRKATFSARVPNATGYDANVVLIKESDAEAFGDEYFSNYPWASSNSAYDSDVDGKRAAVGEGYCILNSGDTTVNIDTGTFYSSNNNIIKMLNGKLTIGGGTMTKNNTVAVTADRLNGSGAAEILEHATAIYMTNGTLSVSNTQYRLYGDYNRAVYMERGLLTIDSSSFAVSGNKTYGIYSTVEGEDSFRVNNTSFELINGTSQVGIYAENGRVYLHSDTVSVISVSGQDGKGIFANGGSVVSENYNYQLDGASSYGIHSTGGTINVTGGSITLASNVTCYGVYAASEDANAVFAVRLQGTTVNVGYDSTNNKTSGTHASSIGVYLASANQNNVVTLDNTTVKSYELGVALVGGKLNVQNGGSIQTKRASAIAVSGGNLTFLDAATSYTVTSANTTSTSTTNSYQLTWPSLNGTPVTYGNTDGIYVEGGIFECLGNLVLTHTGLRNDTNYTNYAGLKITSYAIRVNGGEVHILKGTITATVGGGICCSKSGTTTGNITMGAQGAANDILVQTTGKQTGDVYNSIGTYISAGWQSRKSITGGHAIELNGGNITIYGGTYNAAFGNGIAANGSGRITLYDGVYYGGMGDLTGQGKSGPAAFYGLKVIGGATVTIYGGSYDGGNGGAFVTGIDTFTSRNNISGSMAYVYVYAGTFGNADDTEDAFNVYDMATVVFGAHPANQYPNATAFFNAITMNGKSATIAANSITNNGGGYERSYINIYYGDYVGSSSSGIYNSDGIATIRAYNVNTGHTRVDADAINSGTGFYQ